MLRAELATVGTRREAAKELHEKLQSGALGEGPYTVGLALSGGGIRSATVSLGILQKLAGAGLLKHVDYLSTVSGGGYIGAASRFMKAGMILRAAFPSGRTTPDCRSPARGS